MDKRDLEIIRTSALFHDLSEDELQAALRTLRARKKNYRKNDLLLMAGDLTDDLGMVVSGSVSIEINDLWGNRTIMGHAAAGDYYAEVFAILQNEPLYVDVRALEPAAIVIFDMSRLRELKEPSPSWLVKFYRNLLMISISRNMMLARRSFHTSPKSARGRVMAYLNSIAAKTQKTEFDIPFDRQHMADYLNLDRTALSKELGKMRDDGLIEFHKNHFILTGKEE